MRILPPAALASALSLVALAGCQCGGAEPIQKITVTVRVSPASLDFGDVPVGSAVKKTIAVVNAGTGAFEPDQAHLPSIAGAGFVVDTPCALPLAPGAFCNVDVAFAPAQEGDASGDFVVHAPGGDIDVTLAGHGA